MLEIPVKVSGVRPLLLSPAQQPDPGWLFSSPPAPSSGPTMPVRRGHVAHQNTFLDTIIRKFEGQSKFDSNCLPDI